MEPFFKKGKTKLIRTYFSYTGCSKIQNGFFLMQTLRFTDMIKILGLLKSFDFVMRSICGAFFQEEIDQADKSLF